MGEKYYRCYSIRLKNYMIRNDILPIDEQYSVSYKKNVWIFIKTERFVELLEAYQNKK